MWAKTGIMPAALASKPELPAGLEPVFQVFNRLHRSRLMGFGGPQRLQISDIYAELRERGFRGEQRDLMVDWLQDLDKIYMAHVAKQAEAPVSIDRTAGSVVAQPRIGPR